MSSFDSAPFRQVRTVEQVIESRTPGTGAWTLPKDGDDPVPDALWIILPIRGFDGCDVYHALARLPVHRTGPSKTGRGWLWDGNMERPTLDGSILRQKDGPGTEEAWHGYLTEGVLKGL